MGKITVSDFKNQKPDFNVSSPKEKILAFWLMEWVESGIKSGEINVGDLMPKKEQLAQYFNVSTGTVQNAVKYAEDKGYFTSKQCVGTFIRDYTQKIDFENKIISKREALATKLKNIILEEKFPLNKPIPSIRKLAQLAESSNNTTRLALELLEEEGIIAKKFPQTVDSSRVLIKYPKKKQEISPSNLCNKLEKKLTDYIVKNYNKGDKIAPHKELAQIFNVSVRTIHDAMKNLVKNGILLSRRGQYGTILLHHPHEKNLEEFFENSIFSSPEKNSDYIWKKSEEAIKKMIIEEGEIGQRIPSMEALAQALGVSSNTVRKAVLNMVKEGYLKSIRGKYGGTYVVEMPEDSSSSFTWLAISPNYARNVL